MKINSTTTNKYTIQIFFWNISYWIRKKWAKAFPQERFSNPCEHCGGSGGFHSSYDPSPSGVALSAGSFHDFDECSVCSMFESCASCSTCLSTKDYEAYIVEEAKCPFCGHKSGEAPPSFEDTSDVFEDADQAYWGPVEDPLR